MAGLVVAVVAVSVVLFVLSAGSAPAAAGVGVGCTHRPTGPLSPGSLRRRYGIQSLLDDHDNGHGQTAVLLEFNQSVDIAALEDWETCLHVKGPPVTQEAMPGEKIPPPPSPCGGKRQPACFGEAQGDAYSMVTGAPGLDRLYVIVSAKDERVELARIVDDVRVGTLTGGRRPDVVSLSFGKCQSAWTPGEVHTTEASLRRVAEAGTWFFKAAGDAGPSDCSPHPKCDPKLKGIVMEYPAASPWVTAVGGTSVPHATNAKPTGKPVVWNDRMLHPKVRENCSAGAGGLSIFPTPGYQLAVPGGHVPGMRGLPDVAALAGLPGYLNLTSSGRWFGNGGTSLASPLYAGAFASIRTKLHAMGIAPPAVLNDALYAIAANPARYRRAFVDVRKGNNDIYGVHCCTATKGFDLASGLGELRIDQLADALAAYVAAHLKAERGEPGP